MTLTFTHARIQNDGGVWLCCKIKEDANARQFIMEKKDCLYDLEIKQHREKRSLEANKYLWALLGELASVLRTTDKELYLSYVQKYGIYKQYCLTEDEYKTFKVVWEKQGKAWPVVRADYSQDGERFEVHAYYGSSVYNSKQFSRLLDMVVEDCQKQGIETLSERELSILKEARNAPTN